MKYLNVKHQDLSKISIKKRINISDFYKFSHKYNDNNLVIQTPQFISLLGNVDYNNKKYTDISLIN